MPQAHLYLTKPALKQMALQLLTDDPDLSERFVDTCHLELPRSLNAFWQSGSHDRRGRYHMFEFWSTNQTGILEESMRIADLLGLKLSLEEPTREQILSLG